MSLIEQRAHLNGIPAKEIAELNLEHHVKHRIEVAQMLVDKISEVHPEQAGPAVELFNLEAKLIRRSAAKGQPIPSIIGRMTRDLLNYRQFEGREYPAPEFFDPTQFEQHAAFARENPSEAVNRVKMLMKTGALARYKPLALDYQGRTQQEWEGIFMKYGVAQDAKLEPQAGLFIPFLEGRSGYNSSVIESSIGLKRLPEFLAADEEYKHIGGEVEHLAQLAELGPEHGGIVGRYFMQTRLLSTDGHLACFASRNRTDAVGIMLLDPELVAAFELTGLEDPNLGTQILPALNQQLYDSIAGLPPEKRQQMLVAQPQSMPVY